MYYSDIESKLNPKQEPDQCKQRETKDSRKNTLPFSRAAIFVEIKARSAEHSNTYKVYLNTMNLEKYLLIAYSYIPIKTTLGKIEKMALLLNKINRTLNYGNFEIDYSNGEIAFRYGIHFLNQKFTEYMALNTMSPCAFTVDKYFPAIKSLIDTENSPEEVLKSIA